VGNWEKAQLDGGTDLPTLSAPQRAFCGRVMPPIHCDVRERPIFLGLANLSETAIDLGLGQIFTAETTVADTTGTTGKHPGRLFVATGGTPRRRSDWLLQIAQRVQDRQATSQMNQNDTAWQLTRCDGKQLAKELPRCRENGSLDPLRKLLLFGTLPASTHTRNRWKPTKTKAMRAIILINRFDQAAGREEHQLLLCQLLDAILQTATLLAVTLPEHPTCLPLHPALESRLTGGLVLPLNRLDTSLPSLPNQAEQPPSMSRIISTVARYCGVSRDDILGSSQRRCHVRPRGLAIHCVRLLTGKSTHAIGVACGGRDHSTILHSLRVTTRLLQTDPALAGDLEAILSRLRPRSTNLSKNC